MTATAVEMRTCKKCGETKPLIHELWTRTPAKNFAWTCQECANKRSREWSRKNKERRAAYDKARVQREGNVRTFPADTKMKLFVEQRGICALCGEPLDAEHLSSHNVDHLISIKKGGDHNWENWALVHGRCNRDKRCKTIKEWYAWREKCGLPKSTFYSNKLSDAMRRCS